MLRIVQEQDGVRTLEEAYLRARESRSQSADGLRLALRLARRKQPETARIYDLRRRLAKALERLRVARATPVRGDSMGKIVPLPVRTKVVDMFPDSAPRISA